jgi:hypothetical protein
VRIETVLAERREVDAAELFRELQEGKKREVEKKARIKWMKLEGK